MQMIITSECENCIYATIDDSDKSKVKIHCDYKYKDYYYGQCIPCDHKSDKKKEK